MNNKFSKKERDFFRRLKNPDPRRQFFKITLFIVLFLIIMGLLYDALYGFYILKNTKSIIGGIGGLIVFAFLHLLGEAGAGWWGDKDKVTQPLYRRVFNLFVLFCISGLAGGALWLFLEKSDWWK